MTVVPREGARSVTWSVQLARAFLVFVYLWPVVEPWGLCDAWTGWAVYVRRFRDVELLVFGDVKHTGPIDTEIGESMTIMGWANGRSTGPTAIRANLWSLKALGAPTNPSERFNVAVFVDVIQKLGERNATSPELLVLRRNNRSEWRFRVDKFIDIDHEEDLFAYARTFRLNAFPESYYRLQEAERRTR